MPTPDSSVDRVEPEDAGGGARVGRRVVLSMLGLGVVGTLFGAGVQSGLARGLAAAEGRASHGLAGLIPGSDRFRIYTVTGGFPEVSDEDYRLSVTGMVRHPLTFTLEELRALPPTSLTHTFQCVTGWQVPDVHWRGVRLGDLLDLAEPTSGATALHFTSYDGLYTESLTLEQARTRDILVAYDMLGAPVTREHGGPVRLYVAPMYGYKSAKWLKGIQVVDRVEPGFWEQNGYPVNAWIGSTSGLGGIL